MTARWLMGCGLLGIGAHMGTGSATHLAAFIETFNVAFLRGEMDRWMGVWADDATREAPTGAQHGKAAIRAAYEELASAFAEVRLVVAEHITRGDRAGWHGTWQGVHRASGRQVRVPFVAFTIFTPDGRVQHERFMFDTGAVRRQLRAEPAS